MPVLLPMDSHTHNIICISTIDWDFIWQGHQEIMSHLARQGHRVLFIENTGVRRVTLQDLPRLKKRILNWRNSIKGIRKVMENLYVYSPIVLPFPYSRVARSVNKTIMGLTLRRWTKTMQFGSPVIWTWLPTGLALDLIKVLDGQLVIYYCCDNFEASSAGTKRIRETENILIRTADLVFAHSKALFDRCRRFTDEVHVFNYGFNREVFARAADEPPADLASIKRPILGYVGGVHKAIDFALIEKLALAHPDKSLVFVGPLQTEVGQLVRLPNIHFLGQKRYEELPTYIKHFDLGLIPYALNEYTKNVYPTKLNEYLIMGKPVICTQLPEVQYFNLCHHEIVSVCASHEEFLGQIDVDLARDCEARRVQRIRLVQKQAWDEKIEAMKRLIRGKLEEKAKTREMNWQEALVKFYRVSRRKVAASIVAALVAYGLVFYTPLLWVLAEPLKIVQRPMKADLIVVLAGGIGESGEPGEEYREKVKRGVDLYNQGYADTILLSSGATYVFNEAHVMKALAVSLGVPDAAIKLDERAGGNYLRLLNARKVMDENGWSRMLLVTSHYNGARSRLVAQKNFPGVAVVVTPAIEGAFFGNRGHVAWKHIRAIGHECLAIIYYWWKGFI